jgi:Fe-S-cluster containining protein
MGLGRILNALGPIREANLLIDEWLEEIPEETRKQIPCREGCAHCCYQFTVTTIPEAFYVIGDLIQTPFGMKNLIGKIHILNEQADFLKDYSEDKLLRYRTEWFEARKRCVFLDDLDRCIVYKTRPSICKSYLILGDPELCKGPVSQKIKHLNQLPAILGILDASKKVARDMKLPWEPFPFPQAILWAILGYHNGVGAVRQSLRTPGKQIITL